MNFQKYYEAVSYLDTLHEKKVYMQDPEYPKIYLKRTRYFLEMLGNPDEGLKFIHITGTAGKGTVANLIQRELMNSHKGPVGLFTSPFVTTTIEKIQVNDLYIDPLEFADIVESLKPLIQRAKLESPYGSPSKFEVLLAIGLLYFKKMRCQYVVLEVGAGGRYDATNVIKNPLITIITNIDYDHQKAFGKTLRLIAWEKAGIIKPCSSFWTSERRPFLLEVFKVVCEEVGSRFNQIEAIGLSDEQANIALVMAVSKELGLTEAARDSIYSKLHLPARFETVQTRPWVILDGAHNIRKMKFTAAKLKNAKYRKLVLVIGIAKDKNLNEILKSIVPSADHVIFTSFENDLRISTQPEVLASRGLKYKKPEAGSDVVPRAESALDHALLLAGPDDLILVTGSFFLAGQLRQRWYPIKSILRRRQSF